MSSREKREETTTITNLSPVISCPVSVSAAQGEPASLSCTISGQPPPVISWSRLETGANLSSLMTGFTAGSQTSSLVWEKVERQQFGNYSCRASNMMGEVRHQCCAQTGPVSFENRRGKGGGM